MNQDGERVVDENINKLMVVANESYEEFARGLQTEYEQDCGVTFGKVLKGVPSWFEIDTPVGHYNPDWAILKHDESALYLVRETKGTRNFLKLRNVEADKVRCGQRHFEALSVDFKVVVSANEI